MKQELKYLRLKDECEDSPEIRKIAMVNTGISNLLNLLTSKQCPVRLRSNKAGIILDAGIERTEKMIELFDLKSYPKAEYNERTVSVLEKAIKDRSCNFLPKEDVEKLYNLFCDLEFAI